MGFVGNIDALERIIVHNLVLHKREPQKWVVDLSQLSENDVGNHV